jgi:hypothetical protein
MSVPFGWKPIFTAGRPSASPVPRLKKAWCDCRGLLNVNGPEQRAPEVDRHVVVRGLDLFAFMEAVVPVRHVR